MAAARPATQVVMRPRMMRGRVMIGWNANTPAQAAQSRPISERADVANRWRHDVTAAARAAMRPQHLESAESLFVARAVSNPSSHPAAAVLRRTDRCRADERERRDEQACHEPRRRRVGNETL